MPHDILSSAFAAPPATADETVDSPQQESPGGVETPRNDGAEETVSRAEFNKVVAQRQTAKEKVRHLTAELEALRGRLGAAGAGDPAAGEPRPDGRDAGDADAPASHRRGVPDAGAPLDARTDELRRQRDALQRRLGDLLRDQELRAAAVRANAINPDQVVALLRSRVRIDEEDDGRRVAEFLDADGQPLFDGSRPVTDATSFVALFLSAPENANLVRSTVLPGSGARQAGGAAMPIDSLPRTKAEFLALPPAERRALAARMSRRQRDELLGRGAADGGGYI